jgi:hypothetical protein
VEMIFAPSPDKENRNIFFAGMQDVKLTSPERAMSVEEWVRALGVLEGIDAVE